MDRPSLEDPRRDYVLSLSAGAVEALKAVAGERWRELAEEILEALAPVLSKDRKPPPPAKDRR